MGQEDGKVPAVGDSENRSRKGKRMTDLKPAEWKGDRLRILDQTELPGRVVWRVLKDGEDVCESIRCLRVRGAPLIGIVGAYGALLTMKNLAHIEDEGRRLKAWKLALQRLMATRPTAVNLREALHRMESVGEHLFRTGAGIYEIIDTLEAEARQIEQEEAERCLKIGTYGATLVPQNARVLTLCNTGALATGGIGTAQGVIRTAHEQGKVARVWVPETRPLLQGSRLTAFELKTLGIPYQIVADSAVGSLFARGLVDIVVAGADRIARNGDTANKIGTHTIFALAKTHAIPAYIAAPMTTFDPQTPTGESIPIEMRSEKELLEIKRVRVAPKGARAFNPAFDVTPASFITAFITDKGIYTPKQLNRRFGQKIRHYNKGRLLQVAPKVRNANGNDDDKA